MSDDLKNIEDLFREASDQAAGSPPPPPDWAGMSSMLKESALIKTGAGAGTGAGSAGAGGAGGSGGVGAAAKAGLAKVLGAKLVVKAIVATSITAAVGTSTYVVLQDEPTEISMEEAAPDQNNTDVISLEDEVIVLDETENEVAQDQMDMTSSDAVELSGATSTEMNTAADQTTASTATAGVNIKSSAAETGVTEAAIAGATNENAMASSAPNQPAANEASERMEQDAAASSETNAVAGAVEPQGSIADGSSDLPSEKLAASSVNSVPSDEPSLESPEQKQPNAATPPLEGAVDAVALNEESSSAPATEVNNMPEASGTVNTENAATQMVDASGVSAAAPVVAQPAMPVANANPEMAVVNSSAARFTMNQMPSLTLLGSDTASGLALKPPTEYDFVPSAEPKWIISPYVSFDRSSYNVDQLELQNLTNSKYNVQLNSSQLQFTAGLRGAYNFYPHLWIESGVLFSQKSAITGEIELSDDNGNLVGIAEYDLSGQFLEIPISIVLRKNNASFGWYAKAGIHLSYNFPSNNSSYLYRDIANEVQYTVEPSIQTLNPAIAFGAGLEYNITPQFRLYAEPSFRYALRPVLNPSGFNNIPLNPKWNTLGLGIGVNYYFGKNAKK